MTEQAPDPTHALSFAGVADAYERARPSYPEEAADWLVGSDPLTVLELGAGTGKLTSHLRRLGHRVVATDPIAAMLEHLDRGAEGALVLRSVAEQIPLPARSVDVVVSAQAFHWFDLDRALPEIARVLKPGGRVALVWNERDERIPWVRRLGEIIGTQEQSIDPTNDLLASNLFGYVDTARFRIWQPLDAHDLRDLVCSRSNVAVMSDSERERVLSKVDALYAEFGRGRDGMRLPYLTSCFRAVVRSPAEPEPPPARPADDGDETDALLIDFQ